MPHPDHVLVDSQTNYNNRQVTSDPVSKYAIHQPVSVRQSSASSARPAAGPFGEAHSAPSTQSTTQRPSTSIADAYAALIGRQDHHIDGAHLAGLAATPAFTTAAFSPKRDSVTMNGATQFASKHKTQYYEEQFKYKDNPQQGSIRERVIAQSPVIAELRTNVIIKDEFTLVTDLSFQLAARYTRPDSSIMINLDHSSCLALGGTFDPCYVLTITTVPSQMQPATNKRNAALIQSFMADILSVPVERGIVRFIPVPEENFAFNGNTLLGAIEQSVKQRSSNDSIAKKAVLDARKSIPSFKKHMTKTETEPPQPTRTPSPKTSRSSLHRRSVAADTLIPNVFELPATTPPPNRPKTSNGLAGGGNFAAENGLRLNGVSKEELSRLPNGRPRTIGAKPSEKDVLVHPMPVPGVQSQQPPETIPLPSRANLALRTRSQQTVINIAPQQKKTSTPTPTTTTSTTTTSRPANESRESQPETGSLYSPDPRARHDSRASSIVESKKHSSSANVTNGATTRDKDPYSSANTGKRRSSLTATPKMPSKTLPSSVPPPPPVPESKTLRVSKRKSFLSAFKR